MYKVRFYCEDCNDYVYLEQEVIDSNATCPIHPLAIVRDFIVVECDINGSSCYIENTSSVLGDTISNALETLDNKIPKDNVTTFSCPAITVGNGETIQIYRFTTNLNAKIKIWSAGLSALAGGQLANSSIQIYNETDGQVEYQTNDRFASGSPIVELSLSQKDISIRATNGTGVAVDLHAFMTLTME